MRFPISCYDNFYEDPDYIRKFALSLDYSFTSGSFPGCRSDCLSTNSVCLIIRLKDLSE